LRITEDELGGGRVPCKSDGPLQVRSWELIEGEGVEIQMHNSQKKGETS